MNATNSQKVLSGPCEPLSFLQGSPNNLNIRSYSGTGPKPKGLFHRQYSPSHSFQKHSITSWATQVEEAEVIFRSRLLQSCLLRRGQRAFLHVGLHSFRCSSNSQLLLHSYAASWPISSETLLGITSCPLIGIPPKPSVSPSEACCPALLQRGCWKKSI